MLKLPLLFLAALLGGAGASSYFWAAAPVAEYAAAAIEPQQEGEGEGGCASPQVSLDFPVNNSTFYWDGQASLAFLLEASTGCDEDVQSVDLYNRLLLPGEEEGEFDFTPEDLAPPIANDTTEPYTAVVPALSFGGTYAAIARANTGASPAEFDGAIYRVAGSDAVNDADDDINALPDDLRTLVNSGDRWYAGVLLDATVARFAAVYKIYRRVNNDTRRFTLNLDNGGSTQVRVAATAQESLLLSTTPGYFTVAISSSLPGLYGDDEAGVIGAPAGALSSRAIYVDVQLVTTSDGQTYTEVAEANLQVRPIEISIQGLALTQGVDYVVQHHPSTLRTTPGEVELLGEAGNWQTVTTASIDTVQGTAIVQLTRPGVIAIVAEQDAEGEGDGSAEGEGTNEGTSEGEGEGDDTPVDVPPSAYFWLIALILFILALAGI